MMIASLLALLLVQETPPPELKTRFWELKDGGRARVVVLVPGLRAHLIRSERTNEAEAPDWLAPESAVCSALGELGSVFGFAYSQNRRIQDVAPGLLTHIEKLKADGYAEIVLIGFSAGGIIARQFVEDYPQAGVRKVIQVCTPNAGSDFGKLDRGVRENQEAFVRSLRKDERESVLQERAKKGARIPDDVEFVVLIGSIAGGGDGIVSKASQWSPELREQGIPAAKADLTHGKAMRTEACARLLCRLLTTPNPRWSKEGVEAARKELLD